MKKIGIDIDDTVMNTLDVIDKAALYYDKVYVENKGFKDKDKYDFKERCLSLTNINHMLTY